MHALREHHSELSFPMRAAIARRLEEYSHDVGADTEVEPRLGDVDELITAIESSWASGRSPWPRRRYRAPHRVDVKLDGTHVVDLELALDVTLSLASIVLDIEKSMLSVEHVAFEAGLSTNRSRTARGTGRSARSNATSASTTPSATWPRACNRRPERHRHAVPSRRRGRM
ncbi:MAG TPA: hypothetical protein VGO03_09880 [Acidimicrobiia bacterium]